MSSNSTPNLTVFSRLIRAQLLQHYRVSLPGMGSFIAEDESSKLLDNGRLMTAPTRTVSFSVKETWNDEVLERAYAEELEGAMLELELEDDDSSIKQQEEGAKDVSKFFLDQAKREVAQFVADVESQLKKSGAFHFPGLGTMKMEGKRKEITFLKSADSDLAPQEFGLTSLSVKPLITPSHLVEPKPIIRKPRKRAPKWLYIALGTLLFFILIVLLIYLFREELRPWLEYLLYSSTEREILNSL